jgi:2-dehydro-3-deoxy-D-gluconate 5-dehydrogenase
MIPNDLSLKGKVIMIAGNGFQAISQLSGMLAEAGADLVLVSEHRDILSESTAGLQASGAKALSLKCSPFDAVQVEKAFDEAISQMGKVDVLINSFNIEFAKPFPEVNLDEWNRVIGYNLSSTYIFTSIAVRHMLRKGGGNIISIVAGLAERGLANSAVYCASQGGVVQFTRALALEFARQNIRVNAIEVGWMEQPEEGQADTSAQTLAHYVPLRRLAKPDDIGALLVYLASDASSYITGQAYRVDGGVMAHG